MDILQYKDKLKLRISSKGTYIFDPVRKKFIVLTPEEMVRQLFIKYLLEEQNIPIKHIAVERQININDKPFRFDILVFDKKGSPYLMVECKSHKIKLTDATAVQVSKYNITLKAKYLCITNGIDSHFYEIDFNNHTIENLKGFPKIE